MIAALAGLLLPLNSSVHVKYVRHSHAESVDPFGMSKVGSRFKYPYPTVIVSSSMLSKSYSDGMMRPTSDPDSRRLRKRCGCGRAIEALRNMHERCFLSRKLPMDKRG